MTHILSDLIQSTLDHESPISTDDLELWINLAQNLEESLTPTEEKQS